MCSTCFGLNISIIRRLRLFCWITILIILFLVRCVLEFRCGWVGVEACNTVTTPTQPHRNSNIHRTKNNTTNVVIQQNSRKLLMIDILISETCLAHKKWNKIASDIKSVFYSSTITMMHGPINIRPVCLSVSKLDLHYFNILRTDIYFSKQLIITNVWNRWHQIKKFCIFPKSFYLSVTSYLYGTICYSEADIYQSSQNISTLQAGNWTFKQDFQWPFFWP